MNKELFKRFLILMVPLIIIFILLTDPFTNNDLIFLVAIVYAVYSLAIDFQKEYSYYEILFRLILKLFIALAILTTITLLLERVWGIPLFG
ncbi:hypothetical protein [Natronospora cellulosivora (SeqCode)]